MAATRADAARAICSAYIPPHVLICKSGHHHNHRAVAEIQATGADVTVVVAPSRVDCDSLAAIEAAAQRIDNFDAVLRVTAGHDWLLQPWPHCFYHWRVANFTFGQAAASEARRHVPIDRATVCEARVAPLRLAVGIGGLARTFTHPVVYKSIRGHLLDALATPRSSSHAAASNAVTVFASLRLDDNRPVTGTASWGPGMGTTMQPSSIADVWRALEWLGADARDVYGYMPQTLLMPHTATSHTATCKCLALCYISRCSSHSELQPSDVSSAWRFF